MGFYLKPSRFLLQQIEELSPKTKVLLEKKLALLRQNPFRNKRIVGHTLTLFRIRFEDQHREKRLIYLVDRPHIKLLCIIDRDKDYRDLEEYLTKAERGE